MEKGKALFTVIVAALTSLCGALAIPVLILVLSGVIDYITGIAASEYRGQEISSYKGLKGIKKKIFMWLLVVVSAIVDWLILYSGNLIGLKIPFSFTVACIVAIWLIINEVISILENIKDIGVPLPAFLEKLVQNIKSQIEEKTEQNEESEEK